MYIHKYYKEQSRTGPGMSNFMVKSHKNSFFLGRMVLEWRECEHEDVDKEILGDVKAQQSLRRCGLYKFWNLRVLRARPSLLHMFVDYWDLDTEAFYTGWYTIETRIIRHLFHHRTIPLR